MIEYSSLTLMIVVPATVLACWIDYSQRKVPNWLNAALALAGLAAQAWYFGASGLMTGLCGIAVGIAVLIIPWAMHGMGAGDVKLMGAIGAWFGPWMCLAAFMVGAVVGGVIAVVMITRSGKWSHAAANMSVIMAKVQSKERAFSEYGSARSFGSSSSLLPYGIPLSIGAWLVLIATESGWWRVI